MAKFTALDETGNEVDYDYGNVFFRQPCGESERLVIGPSTSQVKLLDLLASTFPSQRFFILYVLLISHAGLKPGRYQSPIISNHEDLQLFIWTFQEFFEGDGRHHVWIGSPDSNDLLIYDQHDAIFAYGNLTAFESLLQLQGFKHKEFWFPSPHAHSFDTSNVDVEDQLMQYFEWQHFELQPVDEWD